MSEVSKDFERAFEKMKGNFRSEGIQIKDEEKELFYALYTGKIVLKEFYEKMGVEDPGV
ncbi:hypothetical protein D3C73_1145860 [compost metagenome]